MSGENPDSDDELKRLKAVTGDWSEDELERGPGRLSALEDETFGKTSTPGFRRGLEGRPKVNPAEATRAGDLRRAAS